MSHNINLAWADGRGRFANAVACRRWPDLVSSGSSLLSVLRFGSLS